MAGFSLDIVAPTPFESGRGAVINAAHVTSPEVCDVGVMVAMIKHPINGHWTARAQPHVILLYHFHRSKRFNLTLKPGNHR